MTMTDLPVTISIGSPSSLDGRDDGYVTLRVEDEVSGECLVDVEIPAGRWWRLCQGSTQRHTAGVSPHLDRVGKRLTTGVESVGDRFQTTEDEARDLAETIATARGAESWSLRNTNQGWEVVLRWWAPPLATK
jgi:hypothetical protein